MTHARGRPRVCEFLVEAIAIASKLGSRVFDARDVSAATESVIITRKAKARSAGRHMFIAKWMPTTPSTVRPILRAYRKQLGIEDAGRDRDGGMLWRRV